MSKGNSGDFLSGFLFGAFVGAVLALLFAPAPGEELRSQLRDRSIELKNRAGDLGQQASHRAEDLKARGQYALESQKSRFQEAIEEGKKAAAQKKEDLLAELEGRMPETGIELSGGEESSNA